MCRASLAPQPGACPRQHFAQQLELTLGVVWQLLRKVDVDLAEFASNIFEQALSIVDCVAQLEGVNTSHFCSNTAGKLISDKPVSDGTICHHGTAAKNGHLSTLQEKMDHLHEHVLCLIACTDVVDDHNSIVCAGKDTCYQKHDIRCALKHLHKVDYALGELRMICWKANGLPMGCQ